MGNPAWELRAAYMRSLSELKLECDREANAAQVGDIHDGELFAKIERVKAARAVLKEAVAAG